MSAESADLFKLPDFEFEDDDEDDDDESLPTTTKCSGQKEGHDRR